MKEYKMYSDHNGNIEAVKEGWSWPGFFFGFIWAIVKKLYLLGIGVFVIFLAVSVISEIIGGETALIMYQVVNIASVIVAIIFGLKGNNWRETNLLKRGYSYRDTVSSNNPEDAIAQFISKHSLSTG